MSHYNILQFELPHILDAKIKIYLIEKQLQLLDIELEKVKDKMIKLLSCVL